MRKWGLDQGLEEDLAPGSLGFKKVKLIPDGACKFTREVGMSCTWEKERGFGERSWRYSAFVVDGVVKKACFCQRKTHVFLTRAAPERRGRYPHAPSQSPRPRPRLVPA